MSNSFNQKYTTQEVQKLKTFFSKNQKQKKSKNGWEEKGFSNTRKKNKENNDNIKKGQKQG